MNMFQKRLAASIILAATLSPLAVLAQNTQMGTSFGAYSVNTGTITPLESSSNNYQQPMTMQADSSQSALQGPQEDISLRGRISSIPQGTMMMVKFNQPINTTASKMGDSITAVIDSDVYIDNQIVIPMGSSVEGSIMGLNPSGRMGRSGSVQMLFSAIRLPNGYVYPMKAHVVTDDNTGVIRGDSNQAQVLKGVGIAAGGAAAGTLLGTATGSLMGSAGGGAMFGLATGAIAGIGYALLREGKPVSIPSNARMSIVLDQAITTN
jgi:hypothetical protein